MSIETLTPEIEGAIAKTGDLSEIQRTELTRKLEAHVRPRSTFENPIVFSTSILGAIWGGIMNLKIIQRLPTPGETTDLRIALAPLLLVPIIGFLGTRVGAAINNLIRERDLHHVRRYLHSEGILKR